LLSGYFNHRDPNQGTCTNACRWDYQVHEASEGSDSGDAQRIDLDFQQALDSANQQFAACGGAERHPLANKVYLIEERSRPGETMPIMEDEHGTYIMNSKDLRAVEHVERLVKMGIDSLKIEGRTKSLYYVARTAQVYRQAIDDAVAGRPFDLGLLAELEGLANRGYTDGFYERHHTHEYQNYMTGHSQAKRSQYVGDVLTVGADGRARVEVKNRFERGDRLEVIQPGGNHEIIVGDMLRDGHGPVDVAGGSGVYVEMDLGQVQPGALLAKILQ
jgi:putative protease